MTQENHMHPDHKARAIQHAEHAEHLVLVAAGGNDGTRNVPLSQHQALVGRAHVHAELAHFWLTLEQVETPPVEFESSEP